MSGAARTVKILNESNGFGALTISGTVTTAPATPLAGLRTARGPFDTTATNYGLSVGGGLMVSGAAGILRSNGSTVSVAGNVSVNNAGGYITSGGAGSWTVSGSWTNASTSASWSFAAPITFNASAFQTMTFAVLPGAAADHRRLDRDRQLGHLRRRLDIDGRNQHRDDDRSGQHRPDPERLERVCGSHDQRHGLRRLGPHDLRARHREWHARHDRRELRPHNRRRAHGQRGDRDPPREWVDCLHRR